MLYIVSTPIGNLKDITYRAIETLKNVDCIAAEDTRHTKILTQHYNIETPLTSYFEHSKKDKLQKIIKELKQGKDIALVSDAGTPGISDPGYKLINAVKENDIEVEVIPGATAAIAALTASGAPSDRFCFEGFLPVKSAARRKKLESLKMEERTMIFYESPHRIIKALEDVKEMLNDPIIVCVRELTKKFEETKKGKASELIEYFAAKKVKGEFVIVINLVFAT